MVVVTGNPSNRLLSLWAPVAGCMGLIFYASSLPAKNIPSLFPHEDILFHGLVYAILALFFYRALKNSNSRFKRRGLIFCTVLFGLFYGMTDEFHQLFTPGRSCSGFDLIIDTIGSLGGGIIGGLLHKWLK